MPNHVITQLTFLCGEETLEKIKSMVFTKDYYKSSDGHTEDHPFDFNKIIPRPSREDCPKKYFLDESFNKKTDYGVTNTQSHIGVDEEYPYLDWYNWQIDNWGTKWNCYEQYWEGNTVNFQTAWSFCEPIVIALSKLIPDVTIEFRYADEDIGNNCDFGWCKNGSIKYANINGNKQVELAIEMWGIEDDFEFVNGEWVRKDN